MDTIQLNWTIISQCEIEPSFKDLISVNEQILAAFKTVRDIALLTDKRLIFQNSQGITGIKKEVFSLPLRSVVFWTIQNAGIASADGNLMIHTFDGDLNIKIARGMDFTKLDRMLAQAILK